jgi:hypothetical protein
MRTHCLPRLLGAVALAACASSSAPPSGAVPSGSASTASGRGTYPALGSIVEADLRRDLFALGGDHFRGREAGTLDELRASVWLAERMREAGMQPAGDDGTYFQWFSIRRYRQSDESRIRIGNESLVLFEQAVVLAPIDATVDAPLVFIEANASFDTALVRGRAVATVIGAAATGEPARRTPMGAAAVRQVAQRFIGAGAVAVVVASDSTSEPAFRRQRDAMRRGRYGIDTAGATAYWPDARSGAQRPSSPVIVWVSNSAVPVLRRGSSRLVASLSTENFLYPSVNVIGRIRGSDVSLREEHVLFSTHTDHDGVRSPIEGDSIWNGADDNATGSVALLAIGRAFARAPGRRSALFVFHGAEERGLLGSRHFVMHPVIPKANIVAVLNAEMMGRNHPDSMTILGAIPPHRNSTMLVEMARRANTEVSRFALDTTWDMASHPQGWYFRSDHLPYARAQIPAIMYSSNLHPDYHTPRDEPASIDYAKLTRAARWIYATGWLVANSDQRPLIDPGFRLER